MAMHIQLVCRPQVAQSWQAPLQASPRGFRISNAFQALAQAEARRQELSARVGAAQVEDRVKTQVAQLELNVALQKLADLRKRRAELDVLSPADGQFVMPSPEDFPGRHFERGDQVAYVLDPAQFTLLSVVEQGDVARVRDETRSVELRASGNLGELLNARLVREVPAATNKLPSMALSLQGGGKLGIDPRQGEQGPQTLESVFQFELRLQGEAISLEMSWLRGVGNLPASPNGGV